MSSSWLLVLSYLIWILRSKFILSNNLSSAHLWVQVTCLIVRLLPLIIIWITASVLFGVTSSTCVQPRSSDVVVCFFVLSLECFHSVYRITSCFVLWVDSKEHVILQQPNPRDQERVNRPCVALHVKKQPQISETLEVCFLHIQLLRPNVRLLKTHKILHEVDVESSRSPAGSESCNNPTLQCCECISHMRVLSVVTRAVNVGNRTSQAFATGSFFW